jgi:hypothetical protein
MSLHSFDPEVAAKVGVNAAVIYQNIVYWAEKNAANGKHCHDGRAWSYNSVKAWAILFPYMTPKQIRGALDRLEADGLIVSGNFNGYAYDRTKWFAPSGKCDLPYRANGIAPEGEPIPLVNNISKPVSKISMCNNPKSDDLHEALSIFAEAADRNGWPKPQGAAGARAKALAARMAEAGGLDGWRDAVDRAEASSFLRGWRGFGLDWMLKPANFTKITEGNYDNREEQLDPTMRAIFAAARNHEAQRLDRGQG